MTKKYLIFIRLRRKTGRKTDIWLVKHKDNDIVVGTIRWKNTWRQYWFEPVSETGFSKGCLIEIADFIERRMEARKAHLRIDKNIISRRK